MQSSAFDAESMARLAAELQAQPNEGITAGAVLENALAMIDDAQMASLTLRARRHTYKTLGATHEEARALDEAQYALDEGPCVDTAESGEWFRSGDLPADPRWPRWGPLAAEHGVHSMLSVRLGAADEIFGALNLYSKERSAFGDRDQVEFALLYAIHATNALSAARLVTGLETAIGTRHEIGMAQGIVMERYDLTVDQSFAFLRRLSQSLNRKLREVAREIVQTRAIPELLTPDAQEGM
ncbi:GAF and ANTAR domain-containing protein [Cumulibacter manganitolerans]|uniref:GAF and ANTAR domain-containing protein n=1 Tax=Cumulibacter manganitolerans TaxID=1884992 RepID=UPI001297D5FC|nr:GAF and ANTAR domain-containing protein [Cumulibacter manganitolerans]